MIVSTPLTRELIEPLYRELVTGEPVLEVDAYGQDKLTRSLVLSLHRGSAPLQGALANEDE